MIVVPIIWAQLRDLANNDVWDLVKAGAPTNGTSGDGAGFAGPMSQLWDVTNKKNYLNTNTKASPTWSIVLNSASQITRTALSVNGAITVAPGNYVITKAGVLADTLAAPAASPGGDGIVISIISDTANAHTITFTGGTLDSGSAAVTTATFNAQKGASLTVESYNARWKVTEANGVSFT